MADRDTQFAPVGKRRSWLSLLGVVPRDPATAWVLVSARHPMRTHWPGDRPPLRELRSWSAAYPVDITRHTLKRQCQLPCKNDAFFFDAEVELSCSVRDPVSVVKHRVKDVWPLLWPVVRQVMRTASRRYLVEQSAEAEAALERTVQDTHYDLGVRVDQAVVHILLDERAKAHLRRLQDVHWAKAIEQLERERIDAQVEYYKPFVQDERWRLLALHVSGTPADAAEVGREVVRQQQRELVEQLALLKTMLDEDELELFELDKDTKTAAQQLAQRLKHDLDRLDGRRSRRRGPQDEAP